MNLCKWYLPEIPDQFQGGQSPENSLLAQAPKNTESKNQIV